MFNARVSDSVPQGLAFANCYLCQGAPRVRDGRPERMIDTGVHIDQEGFLGLCESCVTHMARQLGLLTVKDVEEIVAKLAVALEDNERLSLDLVHEQEKVAARDVLLRERLTDESYVPDEESAPYEPAAVIA